jgi:hypothetical protein
MAGFRTHRAIPESIAVSGLTRNPQQGQILVLAAILMTFFFVPLAVLVVDTGLVESSYAQLNETVQAAAEDGASMLNEGLYRSSNGGIVQLDPELARQVTDQALRVSRLPGLGPWQVDVRGTTVSVTAKVTVRLFVLGNATLTTSESARLAYGQ